MPKKPNKRKSRSPVSKADLIARLPRDLRPKLDAQQISDLGLAHIANLDSIARGEATEEVLWHWVGGVLTWSKAAELTGIGIEEMNAQLHLATELVERYGRTGHIVFTGPGYQLAKLGTEQMDALARLIDRPTACTAADWGEAKVNELAKACAARAVQAPAIQQPEEERKAA